MATVSGATTRFINVDVVITGVGRIDGLDDGTSISIDWGSDKNTMRKGNDGLVSFAEIEGNEANVTLTLMETSKGNKLLWSWLRSGFSRSVTYLDRNNGTTLGSALCRVQKPGDITKSQGVEVVPWVILCSDLDGNWGDYPDPEPA